MSGRPAPSPAGTSIRLPCPPQGAAQGGHCRCRNKNSACRGQLQRRPAAGAGLCAQPSHCRGCPSTKPEGKGRAFLLCNANGPGRRARAARRQVVDSAPVPSGGTSCGEAIGRCQEGRRGESRSEHNSLDVFVGIGGSEKSRFQIQCPPIFCGHKRRPQEVGRRDFWGSAALAPQRPRCCCLLTSATRSRRSTAARPHAALRRRLARQLARRLHGPPAASPPLLTKSDVGPNLVRASEAQSCGVAYRYATHAVHMRCAAVRTAYWWLRPPKSFYSML